MGKLKGLLGDTVLYGLGSIVPRFINFLLVTIHTGAFDPTEYGVVSKLLAYTAAVNTIFTFGMETAYFRFASREAASEPRIFNLSQTVVVGISVLLTALLVWFNQELASMIGVKNGGKMIVWLAVIMFIDAVVAIPFARLRLQKKALLFAAGKICNILILVALNVYFLYLKNLSDPSIEFVFIANLVANSFFIVFFLRSLAAWRPKFDPEISPVMIRYSYPIMITGLAGMTNEMFSRVTLDAWLPAGFYPNRSGDYALGVFSACYKLAVLMSLAVTAFRYAAEPFFFSNASDKNSPELFARVNYYFVIVCCVLLVAVGTNLDVLKYFLADERYWEGLHIVPVLLLGYLFLGVYFNFSIWFKLTDKTYWGTIITIGGAVITVLGNYLLIPYFGYEGSSMATLICYFVMTASCYYIGQKYYPIPYKIGKSAAYIVGSAALVYIVNSVTLSNAWLALSFHTAVIVFYLLTIFYIERKDLITIVR
jgi:O-antigen/teichoic acid export membrane protein